MVPLPLFLFGRFVQDYKGKLTLFKTPEGEDPRNESDMRALFFPFPDFWYFGALWALLACSAAVWLARIKNRSVLGWAILCGSTGLTLGVTGFAWVVLLASRRKVSLRMKYLRLKFEEQIADALGLPSPVRGDMEKKLLMVLANNPQGLRIGALAQGIGQDWRHVQDLVRLLVSRGKIRQDGDLYHFSLD